VWSQPLEAGAVPSVEQQRARIAQQIAEQDARTAIEEGACQAKFAVTDCLVDVRRRRRDTVADLKRQDASLGSQQRKQKGGDQLIRLEDKAVEARAAESRKTLAAQEDADKPARSKSPQPAVRVDRQARVSTKMPGDIKKDADERALREKKYNERLRLAQERKERKEKNLAQKPDKKLQPLPVPG
jgi:colicin import membrane protein